MYNAYGDKEWRINGLLHRKNGPAIEYVNGDKEWYINNELHRADGPAVEYHDGDKLWFLNGNEIEYDPDTWDQVVKENQIKNIMDE